MNCFDFLLLTRLTMSSAPHYLSFVILLLWLTLKSCLSYNAILISRLSTMDSSLFKTHLQNARQFQKNDVIYIPTAAYAFDKSSLKPRGEQRRRARYDAKIKASQLQILFDANEVHTLELDDSKMSYSKIDDAFKNAGIVYVDGGNTFYLQGYLQKTNFWSTIEKYLKNGCLYVGASAGAIVAGKSIETAFWKGWDDPNVIPDIHWNHDTLQGRSLFNFSIFPHYSESVHASLVSSKSAEIDHPVVTLSDNMAAILNCKECNNNFILYNDGRKEELPSSFSNKAN